MNTEERIEKIEAELRAVRERNAKVEANKAWETSFFRIASILIATYVIAVFAFYALGNEHPFRNAFIPVIGYLLSTQSLPFLKKRWMKKHMKRESSEHV